MMYERKRLSLAGTAIAAALALSSTPLAAQDTAASDSTTAAPAAADTSAVTTTAAPAADPLAPAADTSAATTTTAKASTKAKVTSTAAKAKLAPVKAKATTATKASTPVAAKATPAPAPAAPAPETSPANAAPAVPIADMVNAPKADQKPVETKQAAIDPDMVPYAAGAGLGILALAGAGIAANRRRKRRDDEAWADQSVASEEPVTVREPSFARTAAPVAAATTAPVAVRTANGQTYEAPAGSSPRTIAAYKGPTDENPSLSLKKRLKRARAMDQMEQRNGTIASAPVPPVQAASTKPVTSNRPAFSFGQPEKEPAFQY